MRFSPTFGSTRDGTKPDKTHIPGLYANVYRPPGVTEQSKLPVVVVSTHEILNDALLTSYKWVSGGGFSIEDSSPHNGSSLVSSLVQRSVELGGPVIYVNFNYRLNAFGWLAGKEVLAAGSANIGLYDSEYHIGE